MGSRQGTAVRCAVYCGVDVGEGEHHACALAPDGRRLYNRPLPNDEAALVEVPCGLIFLVSGVHDQVVVVDG